VALTHRLCGRAAALLVVKVILAQRTFRIGLQMLEQEDGRFFMSIRNHTYASRVEIPAERAHLWYERLTTKAAP
jgi:hypothetical protein